MLNQSCFLSKQFGSSCKAKDLTRITIDPIFDKANILVGIFCNIRTLWNKTTYIAIDTLI